MTMTAKSMPVNMQRKQTFEVDHPCLTLFRYRCFSLFMVRLLQPSEEVASEKVELIDRCKAKGCERVYPQLTGNEDVFKNKNLSQTPISTKSMSRQPASNKDLAKDKSLSKQSTTAKDVAKQKSLSQQPTSNKNVVKSSTQQPTSNKDVTKERSSTR